MGFVGNYAPCGLSPQMYDMPVILNKRIADKAIRKVFDAVASDKTLEQLMNEADI